MDNTDLDHKLEIVRGHIEASTPPIPIVPLAQILGIEVEEINWPDSLGSSIKPDKRKGGSSGFLISVNQNLDKNSKRFTIAYQIANFVLHEHRIGYGLFDHMHNPSLLPPDIELKVNQFAANIILPWFHLKKEIDGKAYNPNLIASRYGASSSLVSERLKGPKGLIHKITPPPTSPAGREAALQAKKAS